MKHLAIKQAEARKKHEEDIKQHMLNLEVSNSGLTQQNVALTKQLNELKQQMLLIKANTSTIKSTGDAKVAELTNSLQLAQAELDSQKRINSDLEISFDKTNSELLVSNSKLESLTSSVSDLTQDKMDLRKDKALLQEAKAKLETELIQTKQDMELSKLASNLTISDVAFSDIPNVIDDLQTVESVELSGDNDTSIINQSNQ